MYRNISTVCFSLLVLAALSGCQPAGETTIVFQEDFERGSLDTSRWEVFPACPTAVPAPGTFLQMMSTFSRTLDNFLVVI